MISSFQDFKILKIVKNIKHSSPQISVKGMQELAEVKTEDIHTELGITILKEAAKNCPAAELWMRDPSNILISFLAESPKQEYLPVIEEVFSNLSIWGRSAALRLVSLLPTEQSAKTYLNILKKHHKKIEFDQLPIEYDPENETVANILFPGLFAFLSDPDLIYYILSYANGCLEKGTLKQEIISPYVTELRQMYWRYEKQYEQDLVGLGEEALWDEETQDTRDLLGMLLDVIGDIEDPDIDAFMNTVLDYPDKKLSFFALLSKLRKKKELSPKYIDDMLDDLEMRNWLYDELENLNLLHLAKEEYITQEKLAEGDFVRWLTYPTELGHVPTEIESEGTLQDGEDIYYVYRFRSDHPHWNESGFMAGMSGPYKKDEKKITGELCCTLSLFEPWEERTKEEHVGNMKAIVKEYFGQKNKETL